MTWEEALDVIESIEFAGYASVAGNAATFVRILMDSQAVQDINIELTLPGKADRLASRAYRLTGEPLDLRYRHRWDVALATYVWLLGHHSPGHTRLLAQTLKITPQCWWAVQMAEQRPIEWSNLGKTADDHQDLSPAPLRLAIMNNAPDLILSPARSPWVGQRIVFVGCNVAMKQESHEPAVFFVGPNVGLVQGHTAVRVNSNSPVPIVIEVS